MITLDQAQTWILRAMHPLGPVTVPLLDAVGHAVAPDLVADIAVPSFANSTVDGYAVQSADLESVPCWLDLVDTIPAGETPRRPINRGQAARVMTGAPLPDGADAVVIQEHAEHLDCVVIILATTSRGQGIRIAGSDIAVGDLIVAAGTEIRPAHLGVIASIGHHSIDVIRPAHVGVLSPGNELTTDTTTLTAGKIYESNKDMLMAYTRQTGATVEDLGTIPDDPAALLVTIEDAQDWCDVVVSSGGVSVGDRDVVRIALTSISRDVQWMQLSIKPGKPFVFGQLGTPDRSTHFFGLAGNPVSSMVGFELLVRPALRRLMGHTQNGAGSDRIPRSRHGRRHPRPRPQTLGFPIRPATRSRPPIRMVRRPRHSANDTKRPRSRTGAAMKLSARNQLSRTVFSIEHGAVTTTLKIQLQGGETITSSITKEAAEDLQLTEGSSVVAVIKSSDVIVAIPYSGARDFADRWLTPCIW